MNKGIFVLGASGFIGRELLRNAQAARLDVTALVRSPENARLLERTGVRVLVGNVDQPAGWAEAASRCGTWIDLIQPPIPRRLGARALRRIVRERLRVTAAIAGALSAIPPERRPLLLSISGMSDLAPDEQGRLSHRSPLRARPMGFAHIGLRVRALLARTAIDVAFVHLGTVYGPGKSFTSEIFPKLARGRLPTVGRGANRLALIHVRDAARALLHLATLERARVAGRQWIVADGAGTSQRDFLATAARLLGGPVPKSAPTWLVGLIAGRAMADELSKDAPADPAALLETGFAFQHPTPASGLQETMEALARPVAAVSPPAGSVGSTVTP
jgi:nucleoside-diphosphate-sugar epimerase